MSRAARKRLVLGVGIPLAALVFLGLLIFAFSRILLAAPEDPDLAPWIALLFATNILIGCALAAMIPGTRGFAFLISVLIATIVIGGVAGFVVGPREVHSLVESEDHETAEAPEENEPSASDEPVASDQEEQSGGAGEGAVGDAEPGQAVPIGAQALEFDTSELSLPAGAPSVIAFDNQDAGVPHNVSIYTEEGGDPLFQGEVVTGPAQVDYDVPPQEPGEYFFRCDVHPTTMTGTVTVG